MKTSNICTCFRFLSITFVCHLLLSCNYEVDDGPRITYSGQADIEVANLTTGESHKCISTSTVGFGTSKGVTIESSEFVFKHGDVMQITFFPPKGYNSTVFSVDIQLLDYRYIFTQSPYVHEYAIPEDVPRGTYKVFVSAIGANKTVILKLSQDMLFRVEP